MNKRIKQKVKGYLAEKLVRDKLKKYFYIIPKGISTKGVDIIAINKYLAILIEVKSFNGKYLKINKNQLLNLFEEEKKIKEFLGLETLKLVAIIKGSKFKYFVVNKELIEKDYITINKNEFEKLKDFDYFIILEEIEKKEKN